MSGFSDMVTGITTGAKVGAYVPVRIGGEVVQVVADRDITYAGGDPVVVAKIGTAWFALARVFANVPVPPTGGDTPPAPNPGAGNTTGVTLVPPTETRSYRSSFSVGWRFEDDDVYHGQYGGYGNNIGAVFYGGRPRALAGATVQGATVRLRADQIGAYPPAATTMRLMTESARPGGAPTLTSTTPGPALLQGQTESGWPVPVAWAQALVDGSAGGIAFYAAGGTPYVRYAGRTRWSPAFTLSINWRR
jgi:hypothetical protein